MVTVLTESEPLVSAVEAYRLFDRREPGWVKVKLEPERRPHLEARRAAANILPT